MISSITPRPSSRGLTDLPISYGAITCHAEKCRTFIALARLDDRYAIERELGAGVPVTFDRLNAALTDHIAPDARLL